MKIKYIEDYLDELAYVYPGLKRKSLLDIMKKTSYTMTRYMRSGRKGFRIYGRTSIINGKLPKRDNFIVTRIYGIQHLFGLLKLARLRIKRKIDRDANK